MTDIEFAETAVGAREYGSAIHQRDGTRIMDWGKWKCNLCGREIDHAGLGVEMWPKCAKPLMSHLITVHGMSSTYPGWAKHLGISAESGMVVSPSPAVEEW